MTTSEDSSREAELFNRIDNAIDSFKKSEGTNKKIKVSKKPHNDWIDFKWRQLTWLDNGIEYLIEIYANHDSEQKLIGWNLYTAAYYDHNKKRYYSSKTFAENKPLEFIAEHSELLIHECYAFISTIKKEEIPFAVNLK